MVAILVAAELGLRALGFFVLKFSYPQTSASEGGGDVTILCIGESTTAGLWVKPEESYPLQLQSLLRKHFETDRIRAVLPPHVGQNSSQQSNRIEEYLDRYSPSLVVLMSGSNNEWAYNESNVLKFIPPEADGRWALRAEILFDSFRVYRVARHLYFKMSSGLERFSDKDVIFGHPSRSPWPPPREAREFAARHREAFVASWFEDQKKMIGAARSRSIPVLVMSYPRPVRFLRNGEFAALAADTGTPFVDNEATFAALTSTTEESHLFERDQWHPSAAGYAIVAKSAFDTILAEKLLAHRFHSSPPAGH